MEEAVWRCDLVLCSPDVDANIRARALDSEALAERKVRNAENEDRSHYDPKNSRGTRVVHDVAFPDGNSPIL